MKSSLQFGNSVIPSSSSGIVEEISSKSSSITSLESNSPKAYLILIFPLEGKFARFAPEPKAFYLLESLPVLVPAKL